MNKCNNNNNECWEIVHIPDKPPFPPDQQPTIQVYAAVIDPKHANTLVRKLNHILPLENLRHVKRVRKQHLDGGTIQLSLILCLAGENDSELEKISQEVVELIDTYELKTFITKVCRYAPLSKEEWEEQSKLWPTSFHPPTYNISGITGFTKEETHSVCTFMKLALGLARCESQIVNAAVIVDPSTNEVIARACDQVSCLNPWGWFNQKLCDDNSCSWHPLKHAAIVAIEYSADRDRRLFPKTNHVLPPVTCPLMKKQKTESEHVMDYDDTKSPYLCTGYDIYLIWEPCAMCSMALVHQRVRRIFYAFPNPRAGALGSVHRLQGEKSLNHHYAVFQVLLPKQSIVSKV